MTDTNVAETPQVAEDGRGLRKERTGLVTSNAMNKTIVVAVNTFRDHGMYKKSVRHTKKYKAHDEENTCGVGDLVRIRETRPLSKTKRWRLIEVIKKAD